MIRQELTVVFEKTEQLLYLLKKDITPKNRGQKITEIYEVIEERAKYIEQLHPPYTVAEQKLGSKIISFDTQIQKRLRLLFSDLKQEMKQMNKQKRSTISYENPYQSLQSIDGMFWDQKK